MASDPNNNINGQLEEIYLNLSSLQGHQVNALTKQTEVMNMVTDEKERLEEKQKTIDQAIDNQKRMIFYNDNTRKVSSAYLKITITVVITLGILFLIRVLFLYFGSYIPDMVFNVIIVATISISVIIIFRFYLSIKSRDPSNFDELNMNSPHLTIPVSTSSSFSTDFSGPAGCIGPQCCTPPTEGTPGTQWNAGLGKCIFAPATADTSPTPASSYPPLPPLPPLPTIPGEYSNDEENTTELFSSVKANEAFEYSNYAPIHK